MGSPFEDRAGIPVATDTTSSGSRRHGPRALSAARPVGQGAQQLHRAGGARHGQIGVIGDPRALGIDRGDPDGGERPAVGRPQLVHGGERRQVAHVVAEHRHGAELRRVPAATPHHRPLVHLDRGTQPALVAALVHRQPVPFVLTFGEGEHPILVLGDAAPVQRDGQALGLDVDPLGRLGPGLDHDVVDHRRPGVVLGPAQGALEAVEAGQRDACGPAEHRGQERRRSARNDRDQGERSGELGQQYGDARQRPRPGRVLDDGGQRPVEVEEQGTAIGWPRADAAAPGGPPRHRPRRARSGAGRRGQVLADDHDDVGAGDAADRCGRRERQHLGRLDADGGGDRRRLLLEAGGVVDGRRRRRRRRVKVSSSSSRRRR